MNLFLIFIAGFIMGIVACEVARKLWRKYDNWQLNKQDEHSQGV